MNDWLYFISVYISFYINIHISFYNFWLLRASRLLLYALFQELNYYYYYYIPRCQQPVPGSEIVGKAPIWESECEHQRGGWRETRRLSPYFSQDPARVLFPRSLSCRPYYPRASNRLWCQLHTVTTFDGESLGLSIFFSIQWQRLHFSETFVKGQWSVTFLNFWWTVMLSRSQLAVRTAVGGFS